MSIILNILDNDDFYLESEDYKAKPGEYEVLHHITYDKFPKFRPGSMFGSANVVRTVHRDFSTSEYPVKGKTGAEPTVHTVRLKVGRAEFYSPPKNTDNPFVDKTFFRARQSPLNHLKDTGRITDNQFKNHEVALRRLEKVFTKDTPETHEANATNRVHTYLGGLLKSHGIDTLINDFKYGSKGYKGREYMITDPKQVRVLRTSHTPKININRAFPNPK